MDAIRSEEDCSTEPVKEENATMGDIDEKPPDDTGFQREMEEGPAAVISEEIVHDNNPDTEVKATAEDLTEVGHFSQSDHFQTTPQDNACYQDQKLPEPDVFPDNSGQGEDNVLAPSKSQEVYEEDAQDTSSEQQDISRSDADVDGQHTTEERNESQPRDVAAIKQDNSKTNMPPPKDENPFDFVTVSFYQFKCKFCNASFDRRKTFKKHITNEHGIQPYVCHLCGVGFDHKHDLKEHVKLHASEKDDYVTSNQSPVDPRGKLHTDAPLPASDLVSDGQPQQNLAVSEQKDTSEDMQEDVPQLASYSVTQINPDEHKLQLTKSLQLLAQVSHMRDTREHNKMKTVSANDPDSYKESTVASQSQAIVAEKQAVPNKRKRGRPRRLTGSPAVTNKRKRRQPKKIKAGKSPKKAQEETYDSSDVKPENAANPSSEKVEVTKGKYKLRPQSVDLDYSHQLQNKTTAYVDNLMPFECRYCHVGFKTKARKLRHEKVHKEFKCSTCSIRCGTYKDMKRHEDKHFPDEMKCHFCNDLFKTKKDLFAHEETHNEPVICRWCGASFDKRTELDTHERLHFISKTSNTIFECHFCQKICKSRKSWKSHLVSHSNIKAFECEICHKKYKQKGSFTLHMQRHNDTFYKFTCQYCGKKYGQKALLIIHERTHTNERPFKCTHCDNAYPSKNQLDHHMERVMGVRHMCSFCGKQLNSRSSLEIHERQHTGIRPIKCDFCDMDFIEASSYKYHMRVIHTGERFECKYCGKLCKARGVLNAHMRVHTGERPFKCQFCNKSFRSGNVLRTHVQGIHLGVRHKCEICGREFAQTSALNTHKKLVHEGLKWKDIQLQRKINRENRERRDRQLIENAIGKTPTTDASNETIEHTEPSKYVEPSNKRVEPMPGSAEVTSPVAALAEIDRSMASSMMPPAPPLMAPPTASMMAPSMAPASSMAPSARHIVGPDRGSVDVIFPPAISGTAMYHVL